jgi:hypothetical protein
MARVLPLHGLALAKAVLSRCAVRYGATTLTAVLIENANGFERKAMEAIP